MRLTTLHSLAALVVLLVANVGHANILSNGGFEAPVLTPSAGINFGAGGEPVGFDWNVSFGNIDLANLPIIPFVLYSAYEGTQAVDLNGFINGSLFQDFPTVLGQLYSLTFAYADNPFEGGVSTADVLVTDVVSSGTLLATSIAHSTSTNSPVNADWTLFAGTFTATGTTTRLLFASTSVGGSPSSGIVLDDVSVTAVPEPSSFVLLAGMALIGLTRWTVLRRKR